MGSLLFKAIVGMLAGVASWAVIEPFKPAYTNQAAWTWFEIALMSSWGLFIGASVGLLNGMARGSRTHALKEFALGAVFGLIGISIGRGLSAPFAAMIGTPLTFVGRTLAFACFGAGLGGGIGFNTFVPKRAFQGLIGGAIGGAAAGFLFDIVGGLLSTITLMSQGIQAGTSGEVGGPSRAMTGALLGGAIALMIGIVELLSKSVWLRLELGRNEGKEWVIDKPVMTIGRFERADVPLFGDQNIAPNHAVIQKQGGQYVLIDQGSPIGTGLNGQRVQNAPLNTNDVIQIGGMNLRFITKNSKAPNRGPEPFRGQPMPMQPIQQQPVQQQPFQQQPFQAPQVQIQAPSYTLVTIDGPMQFQRFAVAPTLELGRESSQVPLSFDGGTSRKHALVELRGTDLYVRDLGSTNGTFVNGQKITESQLKMGDILKVGSTSFRIES